ncbi:MAG: hypothetical protein NVSMB15_13880 [Steroidobacteraceae bacterium]
MYPLSADYRAQIQQFIDRLNGYAEFTVQTNALSTQIWGALDRLMQILGEEMTRSAMSGTQLVYVLKVLPGLA